MGRHTTRKFLQRDINTQVGLSRLTSKAYRSFIDQSLARAQSPVEHIDPDTLDPLDLKVSVLLATIRNQGHARR